MTEETGHVTGTPDKDYNVIWFVEQCLSNVLRHARARCVRVNVRVAERVWIWIDDDGVGFPYHGRYALADLLHRQVGPASVRDRVAALGGDLVLTSGVSGSRLEIALPLRGA